MRIKELIEKSGVSRRTIYYYIQLGLLPSPKGKGKDFEYSKEHLRRLLLIKELQKFHIPLNEIKSLFITYDLDKLERMAFREKKFSYPQVFYAKEFASQRPIGPEKWIRWKLDEDVEVHIRLPLSESAKKILKERFGIEPKNLIKLIRGD